MGSLRVWIHGLIAAFVGGAAGVGTVALSAPQSFHCDESGFIALGKVALVSGVGTALAYLAKSPVPGLCSDPEHKEQ